MYNGAATVSWNANTEPDLAGYRLYYGTASGVYTAFVNTGLTAAYTVTALTHGTRYFFAVIAYDTTGNVSTFSAEVSKLIIVSETLVLRRVA